MNYDIYKNIFQDYLNEEGLIKIIYEYNKYDYIFIKYGDDWSKICRFGKLTDDFIIKFENKINWYLISRHQVLSNKIMKKYKDKLDWFNILCYQDLTDSDIEEFKEELGSRYYNFYTREKK